MKIYFKNRDDKKIAGIMNVPDKKSKEITLIIHGFSSNRNGGSKLVSENLTENKLNNIVIDLDNRGESEPEFEEMTITKYVDTIISAVHYCESVGFNKTNIIGTSTGGLSAMACALKYPKINSLILRSASPSDAEWFRKYLGKKGMSDWKKNGYTTYTSKSGSKRIRYQYYEDALKYEMYDKVDKITVPTLMLHGEKDTNVRVIYAKKLLKRFPVSRLIIIKGADHSLGVNGDFSESKKLIIHWLKEKRHNVNEKL